MKAIPIFPRNVYGETFLGFNQEYLNGIEATIELFRRGNITGREMSNQDFGYQSCVLPHDGVFQNLTNKIIAVANEFLKSIEPVNDKLVLFDAECIHGVDKNLSNKNRVSISFNISVQ